MVSVETIAIGIYLAFVNVAAFVMYGSDKRRAQRGLWRIAERTLLAIALLGGGLGALLGMLVFHHKTRKVRFRIVVPIALVLTLVVGGGALYFSDYYHADGEASAAIVSSEDVEVRTLSTGDLAFVPHSPTVGLVFYPGAKVQPEAYAPLLRSCAERGVLCVLVRPPLNFALFDSAAAQGALAQFPDMQKWILVGHSLGGVAAAQYVAKNPEDVDALVFLSSYPASDLSSFAGAALSIVGSEDKVLNRVAYEEGRAWLPSTAQALVIVGGNHAYFGNYGAQKGDGAASILREDQQRETVDAIVSLAAGR